MLQRKHSIPVKISWITRAIKTHNYHCERVEHNPDWTLVDTAITLGRSLGSISEDITIASWLKTHESKIRTFKYQRDALAFIREKKKSLMKAIDID